VKRRRIGPDCSAGAHDGVFYIRAHAGDMVGWALGAVEQTVTMSPAWARRGSNPGPAD
jgi:hypothetical protein